MVAKLWKICCSLKFAIFSATCATFLLMGGSLLFPGNPRVFDPMDRLPLGRWLNEIALSNPGLSWWFYLFIGAILLLLFNTVCCFIDWLSNLRSRWRKTGEYLIHLGVVLLLLGYAWGAWGGWRHVALPCDVGQLTPLSNWPGHYLIVDDFTAELAASGQPIDMISKVRLVAGEEELLAGEVRINQPLLYNGLVITPASFGQRPIGFQFLLNSRQVALTSGTSYQIGAGARLKVLRFLPDTQYGSDGQLRYRSDRLGAPAMELSLTDPAGKTWRGWYFLTRKPPAPLDSLDLRPLKPIYARYSNLTVNYDPGVRLSAAGGLLTAFGCLIALTSFYRKRKVQDRPDI